jgi:hypothetical protein
MNQTKLHPAVLNAQPVKSSAELLAEELQRYDESRCGVRLSRPFALG